MLIITGIYISCTQSEAAGLRCSKQHHLWVVSGNDTLHKHALCDVGHTYMDHYDFSSIMFPSQGTLIPLWVVSEWTAPTPAPVLDVHT